MEYFCKAFGCFLFPVMYGREAMRKEPINTVAVKAQRGNILHLVKICKYAVICGRCLSANTNTSNVSLINAVLYTEKMGNINPAESRQKILIV